jgi:hypothetical protein
MGMSDDPGSQRPFDQWSVAEFSPAALPGLYHLADSIASNAQRAHLAYFRVGLGLLIAAAGVSVVESLVVWLFPSADLRRVDSVAALASAVLFAAALVLGLVIRLRQYDRLWFLARAVAESVRSIAWKFMMNAAPYPSSLSAAAATERYLIDLRGVIRTLPSFAVVWPVALEASNEQLTPLMRRMRGLSPAEQKAAYLKLRVLEERQWYATKAHKLAIDERRMFNTVLACQLVALTCAMVRIAWPDVRLDLGPLLASLAAALVAWTQLKRFTELASAYSLAAQELTIIADAAPSVESADELARYVADAENAISREHTMWLARRELHNLPTPESAE